MTSTWKPKRDFGSILLGSSGERGLARRIRVQALLTSSLVVANLIGALCAIGLATVGIPLPSIFLPHLWWVHFIALPIYVGMAFIVGIGWGTYSVTRELKWATDNRVPTADEARRFRRAPRALVRMQAVLWGGAVITFTLMYGIGEPDLIPKVFFVVAMSGAVVVAISQLLIEFSLRPVAAQVITAGYRPRRRGGIRTRMVVSWLVGSGIPLIGIILLMFFGTFRHETSKMDLFVGVIVLAVIALSTGLLLTILSSTSVTDPIRSVRTGMEAVADGDVDVDVAVYDGTELGDLQAGFNAMVGGLRERDRMRDIFGRHVGRDVAAAALDTDPELGGAERTVGVVFVDVIGSTSLAAERTPTEVVEALNTFFSVIVKSVESHRGLVNKFEGDAVLAIFGAPIALEDSAAAALESAREIAHRLTSDVPYLSAGIGVSYGRVVAGNVGAIERFEYTVIGDPVNESARLSELAKRDPARPLASGRTLDAAGDAESRHWEEAETLTLRGRSEDTVVFAARIPDADADA